ncbi:taste receptor cell protein 1-like [Monodon monoceros]|uniref:taste receptor cell protein 1-like n=1 Tax=Monodon monoceros TaxID=40151 RepID=UPI0010F71DC3|nr:taste receptor cell protein 1-like [Monodon monoceros]
MASWSTSYRLSEIPQACHLPLSRSPAPVMPPKMFFSVWLRPDSAAVNASLVFGGLAPGPSAREVLWTLYRKVKAAGKMLGNLSLDESSLASDGSNLTDLALETTSIHLTAMRPFQPPLLLPGSAPFVLLEKTILRQVTPVLSGFYTARPQEEPLLLFSNAGQWVGVYIEYKFQTPIGTHLPGLANHLARNIMDPAVQKSSIMANADHRPQASAELRPSGGGEVPPPDTGEDPPARPDPLTARVGATFFRAVLARALVQDCVLRGLHALQEAEGLSVEMVSPDLGADAEGLLQSVQVQRRPFPLLLPPLKPHPKPLLLLALPPAFHSQRLNPDNESQSSKAPPEVTQQGGFFPPSSSKD